MTKIKNYQDILDVVTKSCDEVFVSTDAVHNPNVNLWDAFDSLDFVELEMRIEEDLDIELNDNELENIYSHQETITPVRLAQYIALTKFLITPENKFEPKIGDVYKIKKHNIYDRGVLIAIDDSNYIMEVSPYNYMECQLSELEDLDVPYEFEKEAVSAMFDAGEWKQDSTSVKTKLAKVYRAARDGKIPGLKRLDCVCTCS